MASFSPNEDMAITPRPDQTTFAHNSSYSTDEQSSLNTPTKDSFPSFGQPMIPQDVSTTPSSYDTTARSKPRKGSLGRSASLRSGQSGASANPASNNEDAQDESDGEDTDGEGRPSKKKKGQRFYCTDYPPCNLSFTRSEHLARHIRKHTGERPFQCHCLRRFSRLDNLRQHAQTVHLNEDIPADSLAATGTRFQRQVRTDRVRAPGGGRARASTLGSQSSSQAKGHSRNVSTSSLGSASDFGGMSGMGHHQHNQSQGQMGPPPSTPSRGGLSLDTYSASGPEQPYYPAGPYFTNTGYGSPNSVYSADHSGPLAHSGLQSPIAMVPRGVTWIDPVHTRRMSVPSGSVTFQSPSSYGSNVPYMSPLATSSNASTFSNTSMITSPTSSTFSDHHDFSSDVDLKRRTWHPGSFSSYEQRPATSGLSYYQTPDAPKPMASTQSAAVQSELRLPGIASFDRGGTGKSVQNVGPGEPPNYMEVDGSYDQMPRPVAVPQRRAFHQYTKSAPHLLETAAREMQTSTGDSPSTPRKQKRQGWFGGPMTQVSQVQQNQAMSTSPANSDGSEAPRTPTTVSGPDYQPAIIHSNGLVEPLAHSVSEDPNKVNQIVNASRSLQRTMQPQSQHQQQDYSPTRHTDMDRLDALVAVATNESQATAT